MDSGIFAFEKVADWFDSALAHYLLISVRQSRLVATGFDPAAGRARLAEPKPMGCYVSRLPLFGWHNYRRLSAWGGSPYWKVVAQGPRLGKPRPTNAGSKPVAAKVKPFSSRPAAAGSRRTMVRPAESA